MKNLFTILLLGLSAQLIAQSFTVTANKSGGACAGCVGEISVITNNGTPPFVYQWNKPELPPSPELTGLCNGVYAVTVTDAAGQTATTSLFLGDFTIVHENGPSFSCNGVCNGYLGFQYIDGGTPPYTYEWSSGDVGYPVFGVCAGNYTVTITDADGCTSTDSLTVAESPCLEAFANIQKPTCGNTNGTIAASATGGIPSYHYNWSNNAVTPTLTNIGPGVYSVTITDYNQCQVTQYFTVEETPPVMVYYTTTDIVPPNNSGGIDLSVSGGIPPYTYYWLGIPGIGQQEDISIYYPGVYCVTITDATGCNTSTCITVEEKVNTVCSASLTVLSSGALTAQAAGFGTPDLLYTWYSGDGTIASTGVPNTINTAGDQGQYCVTITDAANTCTATDCISLAFPPLFVAGEITIDDCGSGCSGGIDLTVSGGFSQDLNAYQWSNQQNTADISNLCPGSYTVTVYSYYSSPVIKSFDIPEINLITTSDLFVQSSNPSYCNPSGNQGSGAVCEKVCPGTAVTYSIGGDYACVPPNIPISWEVIGASSFTVSPDTKEITVIWGNAGSGQVTFLISSASACQTGSLCIEITSPPIAQFTTIPTAASGSLSICKGQKVFFKNQSTGADLYEWQFGDSPSNTTETSPEHTFDLPGTFTVLLIARTECLCADSTWQTIEVLDGTAPLVDCASTVCPGEEITYTANVNCGQYNWSVSPNGTITGGGSPGDNHVMVQWNNGAEGIITLDVAACSGGVCTVPAVTVIPILSDDAQITGDERVCPQTESVYNMTLFKGSNYIWSVKPGTGTLVEGQGRDKVTVAWAETTGDTWVAVEYDNCYLGCKGRDTLLVKIRPPFTITGAVEKCAGSQGSFYTKQLPAGAGIECSWQVTEPNGALSAVATTGTFVNLNFNAGPGIYRLLATPAGSGPGNTCSDSADWIIQVKENPTGLTGITGPSFFCAGQPTSFTANSTNSLYNIQWEKDDGTGVITTDEGPGTLVTFYGNGPGVITARQISTDGLGCTGNAVVKQIAALPPLQINGQAGICPENTAIYTVNTTLGVSYTWTIEPETAGVIQAGQGTGSVQVRWATPGNHAVKVAACNTNAAFPVMVFTPPVPDPVYPEGICPGIFSSQMNVNGNFNSYTWKNATGTIISTNYTVYGVNPGDYALIVTDDHGCEGTKEFEIKKYPDPNVRISTADRVIFCNEPISVKLVPLTDYEGTYQFNWYYFGSLNLGSDSIYYADAPGLYSVAATNKYGCSNGNGDVRIIENCNPPSPPSMACNAINFNVIPSPECDSFSFEVNTPVPYIPGSAQWTIIRQGISQLAVINSDSAAFRFPNAGIYFVQLNLQLADGTWCFYKKEVEVIAHAQFITNNACLNSATLFSDESTFLPGRQFDFLWHWDFNDNTSNNTDTSSLRNPTWTYSSANDYQAVLTLTASSGCTATATATINIPEPPEFLFLTPTPTCAGSITPIGIVPSSKISAVEWNFGDPASGALNQASGFNVFHQYPGDGNYTATATITTVNGCQNTSTVPVTITQNPLTGNISPASPKICEGQNITLTAPSGGPGTTYLWNNNSTASSVTVSGVGTYKVTISTPAGCKYSPPVKTIAINPAPDGLINGVLHNDLDQVIGYVPDHLKICAGEDVYLQVKDNGTYLYNWSGGLGTGDNISFSEDRDNLLSAGQYHYQVTITNSVTGCTAVTPGFTVDVNPAPENCTAIASQLCAGTANTVSYTGPTPPGWSYYWNNGAVGLSFQTTDPGHFFVTAVNEFGCKTASNRVTIHPGPNIGAIPGGCHTRCAPDSLCIPDMPEITSWQWYYEGLPVPNATSPEFVATQDGAYTVAVTDTNGCATTSAPLYLTLFTGFGDISGQVWSDVNHNGLIDAGDTLLHQVPVLLWQNDTLLQNAITAWGNFEFNDVPAVNYMVSVDSAALPADWQIITGQQIAQLIGCDSKSSAGLLLDLPICQAQPFELYVNICHGDSYVHDGITILPGSPQEFTYQASVSCDSTIRIIVNEWPEATAVRTEKVCPGSSFSFMNSEIFPGNSQTFILTHPATGCDSLVTIQVTAFDIPSGTFSATVCEGKSLLYNGINIPAGTTETIALMNPATGCDSLVTVTAVLIPAAIQRDTVTICPGTSYSYQGQLLAPGQNYEFHYPTFTGECDSTFWLTVLTYPVVPFSVTSKNSCIDTPTGAVYVHDFSPGQNIYSIDGSSWQSDTTFLALAPGMYTVELQDQFGCLFEKGINIMEKAPLLVTLPASLPIPCDSPMVALKPQITGEISGLHFTWSTGDTAAYILATASGVYNVQVQNECESQTSSVQVSWAELPGNQDFVYVPNAVAPEDEKSVNAIFKPFFVTGLEVTHFHMEVFDRWGNLIWRGFDPEKGWDTRDIIKNRSTAAANVFVWWLEADVVWCGSPLHLKRKGDVTILR